MRLLIIGNLEGHMTTASQIAVERGVKVTNVRTIEDGLKHVRGGKGSDLVFIDISLDLGRFVRQCQQERIQIPVIACGLETVTSEEAQEAIYLGAKEFIFLPPNPEIIAEVLEAVSQDNHQVIHRDPALKAVIALADQIAPSEASVMITGESGTGKEIFARYIHHKSKRASNPFVALNCAAIPDNLLESELFGHEKGAFSGAIAQRIGKFEEADGGTILLDEISEMDIRLQAKLLRVIQEKEIVRLGGKGQVPVNVRILATSNRDLLATIEEGKFRQDLYFRLNVVNLTLPALRERPKDILALAEHFCEKFSKTYQSGPKYLSPAAKEKLNAHSWPGNVRELENTIHGAVVLSPEDMISDTVIRITPPRIPQIPETTQASQLNQFQAAQPLLGQTLASVERNLVLDTFRHCLGNQSSTAAILGITIADLKQKLDQYGGAS